MDHDDIIYLLLLIFSVGIGHFIRQFEDKSTKQWISTGLGFILVFIVSGRHILHPILCLLVNSVIILYMNKRNIHIVSFAFTFLYLFFFRSVEYLGIPYPPSHTNLIQMVLTLKLINLALEVQSSYFSESEAKTSEKHDKHEAEAAYVNPSFMDIVHFSFCYVGVLTGPFYRYRTYYDWLNTPFPKHASCYQATLHKMKFIPLFAALYLLATHFWPLQYAETDEFYNERSVLYRLWFVNPSFFIFRMRITIGVVLSECVCTMAGLGAYPTVTEPKPGGGPTTQYGLLKLIAHNHERAISEKYNFETIHNVDPYGVEFTPSVRHGMKSWNICIQYWLAVNVYKRFPSKKFRTGATFAVSAAWHGIYTGYYVCLCSTPFYLPPEDLWVKLFRKDATGLKAQILDFFIWIFRMEAFGTMAIAFLLLRVDKILHYYASIYFIPHIFTLVMYIIGYYIDKNRQNLQRRLEIN